MQKQTLTLKGSLPEGVLARLARRQMSPKFKPRLVPPAPVVAIPTSHYSRPFLPMSYEEPVSVSIIKVDDRVLRKRKGLSFFMEQDLEEQRDFKDDIEPRLRAKLENRPTSEVDRGLSWKRYRATCYRSWKHRRKTQYRQQAVFSWGF